jgi:putative addiction module CopG family antidote
MGTTMNVSLTPDLAEFVADALATGGYNNQSEVARDALRLLRERHMRRVALRRALDLGHAATVAGETEPLTDDVLRAIATEGRKLADPATAAGA